VDSCQYVVEKATAYRNLSELERDGPGVSNDWGTNLYQSGLQAGQRPVGHLLRQISALQEDTEILGQCVQLKADLVLRLALAGQPRPVDCMLAFFDALPGSVCLHAREGAALIVEADDPVRFHRQAGDHKSDTGKQLARMPFDFGDNPAWLVPGCRLILELAVDALNAFWWTPISDSLPGSLS
jgi:hypothetical protein